MNRIFHVLILSLLVLPGVALGTSIFSNEQLLERQKELYQAGDWDAFFGGALYLRTQKPDSTTLDTALALELMALARHCQWALIDEIQQKQASFLKGPASQKALSFIHLKKEYKVFTKDTRTPKKGFTERLQSSKNQWPIEEQKLSAITNPQNVKMAVGSLCPF